MILKCRSFNFSPIVTHGVGIFFLSTPKTKGTLCKTVITCQLFICFMFWGFSYEIKIQTFTQPSEIQLNICPKKANVIQLVPKENV